MKTTRLLMLALIGSASFNLSAQISESTNAIVNTTSYVGTSNNKNVNFKRNAVTAGLIAISSTSFGLNSYALLNSVSFGVNAGQYSSGFDGSNTYIGQEAGRGQSASILNSGAYNTYIGHGAGMINTTGSSNFFGGYLAGMANTTGSSNLFLGIYSGHFNSTGNSNVFLGANSGEANNGYGSTFVGYTSGVDCTGNENVFIGNGSGSDYNGSSNTFLGTYAGASGTGDGNVFIGYNVGNTSNQNNKLFLDNSTTQNPLIWGDFSADQLKFNGKLGIGGNSTTGFGNYPTTAGGVSVSSYNLFVKGGILTEEVRVSAVANWADYVFKKDYNLKSLAEVETFINENGHLPNVPSAAEVEKNGIEVGQMAKIQQEKIEELTLYLIQQKKEIDELKLQVKSLMDKK